MNLGTRRPHLTKEQRLPKSYKEAEKILNKVKRCEANIKTVLNNSKLRGAVLHKVSGLTFSLLKHSRLLDLIIQKTQILEKEPYLRKELAGILIHELIFGNGLPGESKPVETILKYQDYIEKTYNDLKSDDTLYSNLTSVPKYVRVNTLVTTLPEVLEDLEYLNIQQIVYNANISENEFYELVKNMEKNTFLLDYHFKDLLVFHCEENLTSWSLYRKGYVFIQDKSSYIPAFVLAPPPGSTVIDACAAPGMKTLHLTAQMENNGVIYACERDKKRFEILNSMLKSGHANICQTFCGDFNSIDPKDEKYSKVEYILLDPSCSGSGMVSRMDSITDTKESKNDVRIQKLAGFQIILLKHALLFPSVKRVVYSTCSITETENEFVVHEVLNHFSHRFKLSPVLPDWSIRGSSDFEFGSCCLRAYPDKCLTNGFFVAMFERLEDYEEQYRVKKKLKSGKKNGNHASKSFQENSEFIENEENFDNDLHCNYQLQRSNGNNNSPPNTYTTIEEEIKLKKKHKKHKKDENTNEDDKHSNMLTEKIATNTENQNNDLCIEEDKTHRKKHKSKRNKEYDNSIKEDNSLIETEKLETNKPDLADDMQEVNLKPRRKGAKDIELSTTINVNDEKEIQIQTVVKTNLMSEEQHHKKKKHKNENIDDNSQTLIKTSTEVNMSDKNKKHKRHAKEDNTNILDEALTTNDEDNVLIENLQVKNGHDGKKRHKQKHDEECNENNLSTTETPEIQNNDSNDITYLGAVQHVDILHETKKKHKRKHEKEDYNNVFSEKEPCSIESSIQTAQEVETSRKTKKKHKRKHETEDCNENFSEKEPSSVESNVQTAQEVETSHKIKKKHKRKHEKEDSNNIFSEKEPSSVESSVQSTQEEETSHKIKKKHKSKYVNKD